MMSSSSAFFMTSFRLMLWLFIGWSMPSVNMRMTRRPSWCCSAVIATLTAFQSGVGPASWSSVRRILDQIALVAGEVVRIDLDAVGEAADAGLVAGQELLDELLRRRSHKAKVADHAAAAIEHDDDRDRLDVVLEHREVLQLAVVVDLEIVAGEIRDQLAFGVGHRHVHGHGPGAAAEDRLLALRLWGHRQCRAQRRDEWDDNAHESSRGVAASDGASRCYNVDARTHPSLQPAGTARPGRFVPGQQISGARRRPRVAFTTTRARAAGCANRRPPPLPPWYRPRARAVPQRTHSRVPAPRSSPRESRR